MSVLKAARRWLGNGRAFRWLLAAYPPYVGAGVRVVHATNDLSEIDVEMALRWWNRNYVGTHFGGSLYSMADPFYMLMLMERLGRDVEVWDKAATIRFRRPGRGKVLVRFRLASEVVGAARARLDAGEERFDLDFDVNIETPDGDVVAQVSKVIHVRKKRRT